MRGAAARPAASAAVRARRVVATASAHREKIREPTALSVQ
jgi:hypothetical protein